MPFTSQLLRPERLAGPDRPDFCRLRRLTGSVLALGLAASIWTLFTGDFVTQAVAQGVPPAALPGSAVDAAEVRAGDPAKLASELGVLLLVAVVLEFALAVLFNWRVYRIVFNARATKTLVTLAVALIIVQGFGYDVFGRIMAQAGLPAVAKTAGFPGGWLSALLSALMLSGGSAGVYELLKALGLRAPAVEAPAAQPANDTEAWVSVTVVPASSIVDTRPLAVHVEKLGAAAGGAALYGVVDARSVWAKARDALMTAPNRLPPSGGYRVEAGATYRIAVHRVGAKPEEAAIEVYTGSFAPRAVVDFKASV